jgi:prepilin-type processing-associated H-X9-DG protein
LDVISNTTVQGMALGSSKNLYAPIGVGGNGYNNFNDGEFGSEHPGGTHFAMADGSVHFVGEDIDHTVYLALGSRDGKESMSLEDGY